MRVLAPSAAYSHGQGAQRQGHQSRQRTEFAWGPATGRQRSVPLQAVGPPSRTSFGGLPIDRQASEMPFRWSFSCVAVVHFLWVSQSASQPAKKHGSTTPAARHTRTHVRRHRKWVVGRVLVSRTSKNVPAARHMLCVAEKWFPRQEPRGAANPHAAGCGSPALLPALIAMLQEPHKPLKQFCAKVTPRDPPGGI